MTTSQIGSVGEDIAEEYLRSQGYSIVARNYKVGEGIHCVGEIDLAAIWGDVLHIVEVKTRRNNSTTGDYSPENAYTDRKISRLSRSAQQFMVENNFSGQVSFDLIAINLIADGGHRLRHWQNLTQ